MFKPKYEHARYSDKLNRNDAGHEYVHEAIHQQGFVFPRETTEKWRRQAGRFHNQPHAHDILPQPNGRNDPYTIALVLDAILRVDPDTYLNGANLTIILRQDYPQITWEAVTVGRILAEIWDIAKEQQEHPAIDRVMYGGAKQYILMNDPDNWAWLGRLRDLFAGIAREHVLYARRAYEHLPTAGVWDRAVTTLEEAAA